MSWSQQSAREKERERESERERERERAREPARRRKRERAHARHRRPSSAMFPAAVASAELHRVLLVISFVLTD